MAAFNGLSLYRRGRGMDGDNVGGDGSEVIWVFGSGDTEAGDTDAGDSTGRVDDSGADVLLDPSCRKGRVVVRFGCVPSDLSTVSVCPTTGSGR